MNAPADFLDAYAERYAENVVDRRGAQPHARMHLLHQPAGRYEIPTDGSLGLSMTLNGGFAARLDVGAGVFMTHRWRPHGFAVIAPAPTTTVFDLDGPIEALNLTIAPTAFERFSNEAGLGRGAEALDRLYRCGNSDDLVARLITEMWRELECDSPRGRLFADHALQLILSRLFSLADTPAPTPSGGLAPWQEKRAIDFLRAHLSGHVALEDLARAVGLSTFHFARQFKRGMGCAPHAYHRWLRGERAKELLAETDLPIGEIAAQVGYETPQAFARMFRAEVGASPSEYRRERRS